MRGDRRERLPRCAGRPKAHATAARGRDRGGGDSRRGRRIHVCVAGAKCRRGQASGFPTHLFGWWICRHLLRRLTNEVPPVPRGDHHHQRGCARPVRRVHRRICQRPTSSPVARRRWRQWALVWHQGRRGFMEFTQHRSHRDRGTARLRELDYRARVDRLSSLGSKSIALLRTGMGPTHRWRPSGGCRRTSRRMVLDRRAAAPVRADTLRDGELLRKPRSPHVRSHTQPNTLRIQRHSSRPNRLYDRLDRRMVRRLQRRRRR